MSDRLISLDKDNWAEFLEAPVAVLVLGKTDCNACQEWGAELSAHLENDEQFTNVSFGKLMINQPGLIAFKKASPWLAEVDTLPYNIIYKNGEAVKRYAGNGVARLENRLKSVMAD